MNRIDCNVIRDLLPLHIDNACSRQSAELIKEHLQSCDKCQKLFNEMNIKLSTNLIAPDIESQRIFHSICKNLLGIIFAIALMISCFILNAGGAWDGSAAEIRHLITTIIYLIFGAILSIVSRKYIPLLKASFTISLLTFLSAAVGLVCRLSEYGGFISAFISIFASIPFYGLRLFMGWTGLYAIAAVLSFCRLIYTGIHIKKLGNEFLARS